MLLPLAALLAAGLLAATPVPGGDGAVRVEAGSAAYDVAGGTYRLEGGVVISRGVVRLRARSARWDPRSSTVEAAGDVLLTDATRAVAAEGLHAVLDGDFEASGVVVYLKRGPTDLSAAADAAAAGRCGANALVARADRITGTAAGEVGPVQLTGVRLTLCDCPAGPPSWELRADRAVVHPGERVELTWPVVYVTPRFLLLERPVPVFTFPWVALPLGERVTGLLATELGTTGPTGFTLGQPVYVTLGPAADLTATPRWHFGRRRAQVAAGDPAVRGPGASLELRWTPTPEAAGRLKADLAWDLDDEEELGPVDGAAGASGLRLALSGGWAQRLSPRATLRADLDLVGDPLHVRDFTPDVLQRDATTRRSALQVSGRGQDLVLDLSAAWLQPVARDGSLAACAGGDTGCQGGLFGGGLPAFQRWPALAATLLPTALAGPLRLSGRAGLARFAPPGGATSDGGADGLGPGDRGWTRDAADPTELDGRWQVGERRALTRLETRAELAAPFTVGGVLSLIPSLQGAAQGALADGEGQVVTAGWGRARLGAGTTLARRFGGLRHLVQPRLDWSLTSGVAGGRAETFAADGLDRGPATPAGAAAAFAGARLAAAAPPGLSHQLRLALATRLSRGEVELVRAEVGQEVDLGRGTLAEAWLSAAAAGGPLTAEADLRLWTAGRPAGAPVSAGGSWLDAFSEVRLALALADGRGDSLRAGLLAVGAGGSGRLGAGQDVLFDGRVAPVDALATATLGATLQLGPAALRYDVRLPGRTAQVAACQGSGTRLVGPWDAQQHVAGVEWDSPCRCFRVQAALRVDGCGDLGGSVMLDLGRAAGLGGR
ncbi:MAG: LPS-assembly protein LptD [Anaeromyxobacter sp.]|nr:LPS-assembly protein LptD [Anaeromyxobacter sp.]MBL0276072.1 LPS-assembly protein LptD [Anaeromyxobacter sp.]